MLRSGRGKEKKTLRRVDFTGEFCYDLVAGKPIAVFMEKLEENLYRATIKDAAGQPLADGQAQFYVGRTAGVFWPQVPIGADLVLARAANLQTSQGQTFSLQHLHYSWSEPVQPHFDFEIARAS